LCRFLDRILCLDIDHGFAFYGVEFLLSEVQNTNLVSFVLGGIGDIMDEFFSELLAWYPDGESYGYEFVVCRKPLFAPVVGNQSVVPEILREFENGGCPI